MQVKLKNKVNTTVINNFIAKIEIAKNVVVIMLKKELKDQEDSYFRRIFFCHLNVEFSADA